MSRKQLPALAALATLKDTFAWGATDRKQSKQKPAQRAAPVPPLFTLPIPLHTPISAWQEFNIKLICNVHSKQKRGKYQETRQDREAGELERGIERGKEEEEGDRDRVEAAVRKR